MCLITKRLHLDVHIWPDVPELTLTSGADFILKCTGDVPIKWNQNQYDQNLLTDKVRINLFIKMNNNNVWAFAYYKLFS